MAGNEERREVARRLRECCGGWSSGECYYAIIGALGLPDTSRDDGGNALYSALADLIKPSGYECVPGECPLNVCHDNDRIDREALLELADECSLVAWYYENAAPFAQGEEVRALFKELHVRERGIADRIRRALGVER